MPALHTTRRKLPFKILWHNVVSAAARDGHRIQWLELMRLRVALQVHWTVGASGGQHEKAEAVEEASTDLSTLELEGSSEGHGVEPGRGGVATASEEPCVGGPPRAPAATGRLPWHGGPLVGGRAALCWPRQGARKP
jgi:hypothetical protein